MAFIGIINEIFIRIKSLRSKALPPKHLNHNLTLFDFLKKQSLGETKAPPPYGLVLVILLSVSIMVAIVQFDYAWTVYLIENRWKFFAEFMRRTLFEGSAPGASDPAIIFIIAVYVGYFRLYANGASRKWQWLRPWIGFIVFTALMAGLGFIHCLKWVIGRARPHLVLKDGFDYSNWFEFGHHFVAEGIFFGSFPSGHTAAVAIFMTIPYLLLNDPYLGDRWRRIGLLSGAVAFTYSLMMIIGRSMADAHWLSDSIAALAMTTILSHLAYFHVLRVPDQRRYYQKHAVHPDLPRHWEFRLSVYWLLVLIGISMLLIAFNAFKRQDPPWLASLVFVGTPLIMIFSQKAQTLHHRIRDTLKIS